ncbi:prepilin-type N-terminal cleavage/methylation domain-containing protein [bacterium]|nr:prepilin-type N-terminal cleavage/methylation domain-containing protein [bacterium]
MIFLSTKELFRKFKKECGFTLIEAMAATVISTIGITGFTTLMGFADSMVLYDVQANVALGFAMDTMEFVKYVTEASEVRSGRIDLESNNEVREIFSGRSRLKLAQINGKEVEFNISMRPIPPSGLPDDVNLSNRIARGTISTVPLSRFPVEITVDWESQNYLFGKREDLVILYADYFTQRK